MEWVPIALLKEISMCAVVWLACVEILMFAVAQVRFIVSSSRILYAREKGNMMK